MKNASSILLFLLGLFTTYRVNLIGKIGVSEIFVFLAAPFIFLQDIRILKRDGFMPFIWLTIATCVACVISSLWNHTSIPAMLRGIASPYSLFAGIVVIHRLLRKNMEGLKWLALGFGLSMMMTMIIARGDISVFTPEDGSKGQISLMYMLVPALLCPIAGWYHKIPLMYSVGVTIFAAGYFLMVSVSGRSNALFLIATAGLCFMGRKSIKGLRFISRNFIIFIILSASVAWSCKQTYAVLAKNGTLGEKSRKKYLEQTRGGEGIIRLLMGGRTAFFAGIYAAVDRPILGYGPWAVDTEGIYFEFLTKYGDVDDLRTVNFERRDGGVMWLPAHSHIVGFWTWYGIIGLLFWLAVLLLFINTLRKYAQGIPVWYGYIAAWMPSLVWAILFSPFTGRLQAGALIVVCLFMRAAYFGKIAPPIELLGFNNQERKREMGRFGWMMKRPEM